MVAIFPADRAVPRRDHNRRAAAKSRSRQYDSFLVRLWHDDDADGMLRVELEHVQAGLSVEAVQVPLDWIVPEILGCLQSSRGPQTVSLLDEDETVAEAL
jgi:hypothetical protein